MNEKSIWFWWIIVTTIYILFNIAGYPGVNPSTIGHITGFIGLFVPYGLLSSPLFLTPLGLASLVVFIALMKTANKELDKKNFSFGKRILFNLLALLVITIIVDFIRGTPFESWVIFIKGTIPRIGGLG